MKKLILFPFNGNAIEALDCVSSDFEVIGFVDDASAKQGTSYNGIKVFDRKLFGQFPEALVLAVPGSPESFQVRDKIITELKISTERFATIIHPNASISSYAKIGYNVLVMAGVVITSNAVIENHVCILPNTVVHHDSVIQEYCLLGSNVTLAGSSVIEEKCYIGSGASIINGIRIEKGSLIGIGSTVLKSVEANSKVVGNPGRKI